MSCCCLAEVIIIRSGTSTAFSMFDSYVERNLPDLITANQTKMSSIHRKMTVVISIPSKVRDSFS